LLFLEIFDENERDFPEMTTVLDDELQEYLKGLDDFPALQALGGLDREEDFLLDEALRESLWEELALISPRVQQRDLPDPPSRVGTEGLEDLRVGDEFGWMGLIDFLGRLQRLLTLARKQGLELWACG
jgi:hypothetical protein